MGKTVFLIFIFFFNYTSSSFAQNSEQEKFFKLLINDDEEAINYISPQEIEFSQRLNTTYVDVKSKLLLAFFSYVNHTIKEKIRNEGINYSVRNFPLEDGYTKSTFSVPGLNYSVAFYFRNNKVVTPLTYFTRNWKKQSGRYFNFLISDENIFNQYSIDKLDEFVERTGALLDYTENDWKLLGAQKVLYVFCRNTDEITNITGSISKGRYLSEIDAVVTTYSCHFHEVAHLLLNYKIKENSLYPVPFLQEGFAVATGGRGGQSNNVLNDVGYFIAKYNFANYKPLFEYLNFNKEDPSISYPLAGIFSKYLLETLSIDDYLSFYNQIKVDTTQKLFDDFNDYVSQYRSLRDISFTASKDFEEVLEDSSFFLSPQNPIQNYSSTKFYEIFKDKVYKGEKYYFAIDKKEINIYNLYSNELIASYVNSFAETPVEYFNNGRYKFYISKTLLDENPTELSVSYR